MNIPNQTELKDTKICIFGIQGSGKTEMGKYIANAKAFKKPFWYLINLDDVNGIPKKCALIKGESKNFAEMDMLCGEVMKRGLKGECDLLVIDEADLVIPKSIEKLQKYKNIHDLAINHRHFKVAVVFMTRRPQDMNPLIVESSEHKFIYALETSDNILRKMKAVDYRIPDMMKKLHKKLHNFIYKRLGEEPKLMDKIKLTSERGTKQNAKSKNGKKRS